MPVRATRRSRLPLAVGVAVLCLAMAGTAVVVGFRNAAQHAVRTSVAQTSTVSNGNKATTTPPTKTAPQASSPSTTPPGLPSTTSPQQSNAPHIFPPIGETNGAGGTTAPTTSSPTTSVPSPKARAACVTVDCPISGASLSYGGGPIVATPHVYLVQLSTAATGGTCATQSTGTVTGIFANTAPSGADAITAMLTSSYSSWWSEYSAGGTSISQGSYAGCFTLHSTWAANATIDDSDIQNLIKANASLLPNYFDPADFANSIYVLSFQSGQTITAGGATSGVNFCAYHNAVASPQINYAVMPNVAGVPGCNYSNTGSGFNNWTAILSHEIAEVVTDPAMPLAWTQTAPGPGQGMEIGDLCAWSSPATVSSVVASPATAQGYYFQYLYSNVAKGCIAAPYVPPPPPPAPLPLPSSLTPGQSLSMGQTLLAPNGAYRLVFQTDGNLVEYTSSNHAVWASGTSGRGGAFVVFQTDGNVVIYNAANQAVWASGSTSSHPASLSIGSDGTLVATNTSGQWIWSDLYGAQGDPFWGAFVGSSVMRIGDRFTPGAMLTSPNGDFVLEMQSDGNLVLYGPHGALWSTASQGRGSFFVFQTDGNLVLYTPDNVPLWSTASQNRGATFLNLQNDGNFVIYTANNVPVWASGT